MSKQVKAFVFLFIFFLIVCGLVFSLKQEQPEQKAQEQTEEPTMHVPFETDTSINLKGTEIPYNYPVNLSGKSKEEVFELRKQYVANSIFADENYSPSEEVFGEIESGKPWIALNNCLDPETSASRTDGVSEEARFILNPSILVAVEHPFNFHEDNLEWCTNKVNVMLPERVVFNEEKNEISIVYRQLPFVTNSGDFYTFNGINARDFGYKYAYVDLSKSTFQPEFAHEENVSNTVAEFQNFIHLGGSCGVEGGCNNGSPNQPMLNFYDTTEKFSDKSGVIYIKLWKNPPASPEDEPDITEKIIIEKL